MVGGDWSVQPAIRNGAEELRKTPILKLELQLPENGLDSVLVIRMVWGKSRWMLSARVLRRLAPQTAN
jgi:hypothetical protein